MINVSEKETIKRLSKRLQCSKCNNLFIAGPKLKAGSKCPKCGGILITRSDDKPPAIKRRLKIYRKRTLPVIRFFNQQGLLIKINGEQSVAAVHKDILQALRRRNLIG
jgi:adenylate kinase